MMLGLIALPYSAISQQWSIKDQLVGTWTLVSWEHALPSGSKDQSYGTNPKGIVVFDAKGRRASRPSENRAQCSSDRDL
jgi:hypothetical protein